MTKGAPLVADFSDKLYKEEGAVSYTSPAESRHGKGPQRIFLFHP